MRFNKNNCIPFFIEYVPNKCLYGFPDYGEGFKIAFTGEGPLYDDPDSINRDDVPELLERLK